MGEADKSDTEPILIGRLGRPWGLRGELIFRPEGSGELSFHRRFDRVILEGVPGTIIVEGWRIDGSGKLYVGLRGVDTPEKAKPLANRSVYVRRDELPETGEGVFYVYQLVGLAVVYEDDEELGRVVDIAPGSGGANDVLVVETARGDELLFPFVRAAVVRVDVEAGRIVLRRMEEERALP